MGTLFSMTNLRRLAAIAALLLFLKAVTAQSPTSSLREPGLFRENKGQVTNQFGQPRPDILASVEAPGMQVHIDARGMHLQLQRAETGSPAQGQPAGGRSRRLPESVSIYRVDLSWVGANPSPSVEYLDPVDGYENFFNVPDGIQPAIGVRSYRQMKLRQVYPGIDVRFYYKDGTVEYDYEVAPHADPGQIRLAVQGASLGLAEGGELAITTPMGEIRQGRPVTIQDKREVSAAYRLDGGLVQLQLGNYDRSRPLVIDPPVRVWGTYYGGPDYDLVTDISLGPNGSYADLKVIVCGATTSTSNIATSGTHSSTLFGATDVFISRFTEAGQRIWATYFGGRESEGNGWNDFFTSCAVDPEGDIYLAGYTESKAGIATPGSFQPTHNGSAGSSLGFLVRFDTSGNRIWGTYIGDPQYTAVSDCGVDAAGNVYITGFTQASGLATAGAHKETVDPNGDAFLMCFNGLGQRQWGTYFGGARSDRAAGLAIANGRIAIVGTTNSFDGIGTTGVHQPSWSGGIADGIWKDDAMVAVFDLRGTLIWGSYFGTAGSTSATGQDRGLSVAMDAAGNVYFSGTTSSFASAMTTAGAFMTAPAGGIFDGFLACFNNTGGRVWSTFYGTQAQDDLFRVSLLGGSKVVAASHTGPQQAVSSGQAGQMQITTAGSFQPDWTCCNGFDAYFAVFDAATGAREYGTYYGGEQPEELRALTTAPDGSIYLGGGTFSRTKMTTAGAHQVSPSFPPAATFPNYNQDAFIARFNYGEALPVTLLSLTGRLAGGRVDLNWQTQSESNSAWFEVEKQVNEQTQWQTIARVPAAGNSATPRSYAHTDADIKPASKYRYRLRMVDRDGSFRYSPVVQLASGTQPGAWQLRSPLRPGEALQLFGTPAGSYRLVDLQGRLLGQWKLNEGTHSLPVRLAQGTYLLQQVDKGETRRLLVQ